MPKTKLDASVASMLTSLSTMPRGVPWVTLRERVGDQVADAAAAGGYVKVTMGQTFLSRAGRSTLKVEDYTAHDPSTWTAKERDSFYRFGFCHVLALAIHEKRGFPLVAVRDRSWPDETGEATVVHIFAEDADGTAYDIGGPAAQDDIHDECSGGSAAVRSALETGGARTAAGAHPQPDLWFQEVGTPAALLRLISGPKGMFPFDREDIECAMRVVDLLELEHGRFGKAA